MTRVFRLLLPLLLVLNLAATSWGIQDVEADAAWMVTRGEGVTVAVVDSGVDESHLALSGHVVGGYDVWDGDSDPADGCGHGTALASIVAEVAPEATILPVRVIGDECFGTYSRIVEGIKYAMDAGAHIILIASGAYWPSFDLAAAVQYAQENDVLVVGGAGNDGTTMPFYPAAYALNVTAIDRAGVLYWRSNYGPYIDLAAPGVGVKVATLDGNYITSNGTSLAAAYAAGAAALVRAGRPELTANEVAEVLSTTTDECGAPGYDEHCGYGRINVMRALLAGEEMHLPLVRVEMEQ